MRLSILFCGPTYEPQKSKENKQKTAKMRFYLFWQPQLDDFRTLLLHDYDEIVRNINELSEWIENNK